MNLNLATYIKFFTNFFDDLELSEKCKNCDNKLSENHFVCQNCGVLNNKVGIYRAIFFTILITSFINFTIALYIIVIAMMLEIYSIIVQNVEGIKGILLALFIIPILIFPISISINYFDRSDFEIFAVEMCILEGKYTKRICSCSANKMDTIYSDNEKEAFREIVAGNIPSFKIINSIAEKSEKIITECAF